VTSATAETATAAFEVDKRAFAEVDSQLRSSLAEALSTISRNTDNRDRAQANESRKAAHAERSSEAAQEAAQSAQPATELDEAQAAVIREEIHKINRQHDALKDELRDKDRDHHRDQRIVERYGAAAPCLGAEVGLRVNVFTTPDRQYDPDKSYTT